MAGLRFLERLRQLQKDPERRLAPTPEEVTASVINYVSKILNTRKGSTVLDENFGISDFTSLGLSFTKEDMPHIEQEIASFIERFEPRLRNVEVTFTPDSENTLQMIFSLNAELCYQGDDAFSVHFVTRVDPLGRVIVSQ